MVRIAQLPALACGGGVPASASLPHLLKARGAERSTAARHFLPSSLLPLLPLSELHFHVPSSGGTKGGCSCCHRFSPSPAASSSFLGGLLGEPVLQLPLAAAPAADALPAPLATYFERRRPFLTPLILTPLTGRGAGYGSRNFLLGRRGRRGRRGPSSPGPRRRG